MLDLAARLAALQASRRHLVSGGANPFAVAMERMLSATEAVIQGRRTILVGTNNYLGLSFAPACIAAAQEAAGESGVGTTGSRAANGTYALHRQLERRLADLFGREEAIVFSTGYLANLGVLSGVAGPDDTILLDADSHACIYDGARLSGATLVRFRHNDCADLEKRIGRLPADRAGNLFIVVESVYSMLGDRAPIAELVAAKRRHGAVLIVDEAHSFGVFGRQGRGLCDELGQAEEVDFIVGTFSKSVGTVGGFCIANRPGLDLLRYTSRPYVFSASLPPPVVAAALAALELIDRGDELRRRLWRNVRSLQQGLQRAGLEVVAAENPIVAVRLPSEAALVAFWNGLLERGVYVNLALPPGTPKGVYLLRCSVSAEHTEAQLAQVTAAFAALRTELGLGAGAPLP